MKQVYQLFRFVIPYWRRGAIALLMLTAVVLVDLAIPRLVQRIIDDGIHAKDIHILVQTTIVMLLCSLFSALFAIGNNYFSIQVGEGVARDLREALFSKIQSFSFGNLDHFKTGQLMIRISSDTSIFQRLVQVSLRIGTRAPLLMAGSLILMIRTSSHLAFMMLPLLVITSVIIVLFIFRMGPLFLIIQQKLDRFNTVLQENISGVRVVKAFVRQRFEAARFEEVNAQYVEKNIQVMQFMATMSPSLSIFVNLGIVIVIWAGGLQAIHGSISTGQLVAFINYLQTTMHPLMVMVMLANVWAAAISSAGRINQVLGSKPEVEEPVQAVGFELEFQPSIVFEDVCFHYNTNGSRLVLDHVGFQVEPGETVAILGATGSGKSTIANLITRFYDVSEGRILIGGVDIRTVAQKDLLARIGLVPQETVLFSGTVRDNIAYGNPHAAQEQVVAAARAAQAHEFIMELQDGYDTHVEQRGVNLSGGQKQRIAIARALLLKPDILILDDSTSSVDVDTETRIHAAIQEWSSRQTCILIAQRISTVLNADRILVIDEGSIVAQGRHQNLLKDSSIYREIYNSQLGNGLKPENR